MNVGDLIYDHGLGMYGIIFARIDSLVPFRVYYSDGVVDHACEHDLEYMGERT